MAGIIIEHKAFTMRQVTSSGVRDDLTLLLPKDKLDKFEEFALANCMEATGYLKVWTKQRALRRQGGYYSALSWKRGAPSGCVAERGGWASGGGGCGGVWGAIGIVEQGDAVCRGIRLKAKAGPYN
jgi:hypothetical protein